MFRPLVITMAASTTAAALILVAGAILAAVNDVPYSNVLLLAAVPFALAALRTLALIWRVLDGLEPSMSADRQAETPTAVYRYSNSVEPETVRLVPFVGTSELVDGVPAEDLRHFCEMAPVIGWSQRTWRGRELPSGAVCDNELWRKLCKPLRRVGILQGVTKGGKGYLTVNDPAQILDLLGLE